ncbi:GntR family transcriptional regulator [Acidisoma sp. 7E03]
MTAEVSRHIRENGLLVGAALPSEGQFAARLGVSRAVAREGFRSLAALGLIDVANGRRARVAAADEGGLSLMLDHAINTRQVSVQQILDVRRTIELRTAVLAALRRSPAAADEIEDRARAMQADIDVPAKVMEHDIAFHEAIARASQNALFTVLVRSFQMVTRNTWPVGWTARMQTATRAESIACHVSIAVAIRQHDAKGAAQAMTHHFDSTVKTLIDAGVV